MSYILDALRKSEEERQKSRSKPAGSGFTFIKDTTPPKKKFAFGLILTSFMLLAALILGAGWWWSQQDQQETAETKEEVQSAQTIEKPADQQERVVASEPAPQRDDPTVADTSPSPAPPPQPIEETPYLSEMSADFQANVPKLTFSGHVYSPEPSLRMIMINDAVVREGDPLGNELRLEEITEDGVIVDFKQTRFQIKLF